MTRSQLFDAQTYQALSLTICTALKSVFKFLPTLHGGLITVSYVFGVFIYQ